MATIMAIQKGYCPEQDEDYWISVEYYESRFLGDPNTYYKKLGFRCRYAQNYGCESCGASGGDCPLFKTAQYS